MHALVPVLRSSLLLGGRWRSDQGDDIGIPKEGRHWQFADPGATATDNYDGDLTEKITTEGLDLVDTSVPGTYEVTYFVADSAGNVSERVRRTVIVGWPETITVGSLSYKATFDSTTRKLIPSDVRESTALLDLATFLALAQRVASISVTVYLDLYGIIYRNDLMLHPATTGAPLIESSSDIRSYWNESYVHPLLQ